MLDKQLCNLQHASSFRNYQAQVPTASVELMVWGNFASHDVSSKCSRPLFAWYAVCLASSTQTGCCIRLKLQSNINFCICCCALASVWTDILLFGFGRTR